MLIAKFTREKEIAKGRRKSSNRGLACVCASVLSCSLFCVRVYVRTCVRMIGNVWWSVRAKERMRDGARKMENIQS